MNLIEELEKSLQENDIDSFIHELHGVSVDLLKSDIDPEIKKYIEVAIASVFFMVIKLRKIENEKNSA